MESPGLWGWLDEGTFWKFWVVGVLGGGVLLAGLNAEFSSIWLNLLGSTTAKWGGVLGDFSACKSITWSWFGWLSFNWLWIVAETTDGTISGKCGFSSIGFPDCFGGFRLLVVEFFLILESLYGNAESSSLACVLGSHKDRLLCLNL